MGREFLLNTAHKDPSDTTNRWLDELQITREDILTWEAGDGSFKTPEGKKVSKAIARFVDESIIRPNPAERPIWASSPYLNVIWQLKSYFYSFGKIVVGGMGREIVNRHREDGDFVGGGMLIALAGATLLPLAAFGMEMKEYTKWMLQALMPGMEATGSTFRSDYLDTGEYLVELIDRTGIYGPLTIPISAINSWIYRGDNPLVSQIPIVDFFDQPLLEGKWDRVIPVVNNL
jgi:hypothetical protein